MKRSRERARYWVLRELDRQLQQRGPAAIGRGPTGSRRGFRPAASQQHGLAIAAAPPPRDPETARRL